MQYLGTFNYNFDKGCTVAFKFIEDVFDENPRGVLPYEVEMTLDFLEKYAIHGEFHDDDEWAEGSLTCLIHLSQDPFTATIRISLQQYQITWLAPWSRDLSAKRYSSHLRWLLSKASARL